MVILLACTFFQGLYVYIVNRLQYRAVRNEVAAVLAAWYTLCLSLQLALVLVDKSGIGTFYAWRYVILEALTAIAFGIIANREHAEA